MRTQHRDTTTQHLPPQTYLGGKKYKSAKKSKKGPKTTKTKWRKVFMLLSLSLSVSRPSSARDDRSTYVHEQEQKKSTKRRRSRKEQQQRRKERASSSSSSSCAPHGCGLSACGMPSRSPACCFTPYRLGVWSLPPGRDGRCGELRGGGHSASPGGPEVDEMVETGGSQARYISAEPGPVSTGKTQKHS